MRAVMVERIFASERAAGLFLLAAGSVLLIVVGLLFAMTGGPSAAARRPSAGPVHTELLQPTADATWKATPQVPHYGDSAPIAMQAVNAWLLNDRAELSTLVTPAVLKAVQSVPPPSAGQTITSVETIAVGHIKQTVRVRTTDGLLELEMFVIDGRWLCRMMRYVS